MDLVLQELLNYLYNNILKIKDKLYNKLLEFFTFHKNDLSDHHNDTNTTSESENDDEIIESENDDITESENDDITESENDDEIIESENDEITESENDDITESENDEITESENDEITESENDDSTESENDEITESENDEKDGQVPRTITLNYDSYFEENNYPFDNYNLLNWNEQQTETFGF